MCIEVARCKFFFFLTAHHYFSISLLCKTITHSKCVCVCMCVHDATCSIHMLYRFIEKIQNYHQTITISHQVFRLFHSNPWFSCFPFIIPCRCVHFRFVFGVWCACMQINECVHVHFVLVFIYFQTFLHTLLP